MFGEPRVSPDVAVILGPLAPAWQVEFLLQEFMAKHSQSTEKSILDRIRGHGRGWVFTPRHFLDLASRPAITSALRRQTEAGTIRLPAVLPASSSRRSVTSVLSTSHQNGSSRDQYFVLWSK